MNVHLLLNYLTFFEMPCLNCSVTILHAFCYTLDSQNVGLYGTKTLILVISKSKIISKIAFKCKILICLCVLCLSIHITFKISQRINSKLISYNNVLLWK